jgi:hypothetical protein
LREPWEEGFSLNPVEVTTKEQVPKVDCDDDEESYQALKEILEEDNEFCEQLLENYHNKYLLVGFCMHRREEYNTIL